MNLKSMFRFNLEEQNELAIFEIKSIKIINKNSTFSNILFFENIKTDIEIDNDKLEINIESYKDFFINQL